MPFVVPTQTSHDTGHERIIERSPAGLPRSLQFVEGHVDEVEVHRQ